MDPTAFFSPEELSAWADQRVLSLALHFTGLGIKLTFLAVVPLTGIHVVLRRLTVAIGDWLYRRRSLVWLGSRVRPLGGVVRVLEKLGSGGQAAAGVRTQWLTDALFPVLLLSLYALLLLPLGFFHGYVLQHERGLANITLSLRWTDWTKSLIFSSLIAALLGIGLFGLARRLRRSWWLWLWGAVVGGLLIWSMLSPYRARLYHDYSPLEDGPLRSSIDSVLAKAGFDAERVEVVNSSRRTKAAGAHVMGEGPTKRVILSDNLLADFHPREILVAVGHEAGHHMRDHSTRTWLTTALGALVFLALCRLVLWGAPRIRRLRLKPDADPATLPLMLLVFQLLFMANDPLSAWLNRQEERRADEDALRLTQDPAAFCSLFIRLNRLNQADPDPPAWVRWLSGHPSTMERIQSGFEWADAHGMHLGPGALPLPAPQPGGG